MNETERIERLEKSVRVWRLVTVAALAGAAAAFFFATRSRSHMSFTSDDGRQSASFGPYGFEIRGSGGKFAELIAHPEWSGLVLYEKGAKVEIRPLVTGTGAQLR